MKIIEFGFKNICSYGNIMQEFKFSGESELILIEGTNGAGKSSIGEALTISIYGKSAVRKMKDIPNRRNKHAFTYNKFLTSSGDLVEIQRGIDPNSFQLTVNGESRNLPDKRRIDDLIENELTEIPFDVFSNTISLSFEELKSFVKLTPTDKRKIVDKILGTGDLTEMKDAVKDDIRQLKHEITVLNTSIESNESLIEKTKVQLKVHLSDIKKQNEDKILKLQSELDSKKEAHSKLKEEYLENKPKVIELEKKKKEYLDSISKSNKGIGEIENRLETYHKGKCHHCFSDLTGDEGKAKHKKLKERLEELQNTIPETEKILKEVKEELSALTTKQDSRNSEYREIGGEIKSIERQIEGLQKENENSSKSDSFEKLIKDTEDEIAKEKADLAVHEAKYTVVSEMEILLSDDGIKKTLMDKIIPVLNAKILKISKLLDFKFAFEFDNKFDPIISHLGMEISPESLSSGERKKLNMIVLLSMIELIKMKHPHINIMFLDEVFVNLDKENIYKVVEILKDFVKKNNMAVFVISHETLPEEFFDKKIKVQSRGGFSEMEVTEISSKYKTLVKESV